MALILILILGFYLRFYHADYPVVGYHNWKETHYLTEARNFARDGFFKHGFFVPAWDYPSLNTDPSGVHSDTFPTTSIVTGFFFKIFGFELMVARIVNILFALGSIFLMYLLVKRLFKREDLALVTAAIMTINPLLVFFGRQTQLINAALFFCLMGTYFYLKWLDDKSWKNAFLFSFPLFLGIATKYSFALFFIPILILLPYKKILLEKKGWPQIGFIVLFPILALIWVLYSGQFSKNIAGQLKTVKLGLIFDSGFWTIMHSFFKDNYTIIGVFFAIFGIVMFMIFYKNFKHKRGKVFILFYLIGSILWFILLTEKLQGHNYHQYPILPLIVFFIAYGFLVIATNISKIFNFKFVKVTILIILILLLLTPSLKAKNRMFDTQFYGLDVAGEYINSNKLSGERIMHSSHQAYGLLWHGDIKGTKGIPASLEDIKFAEKELNANWIFIYNWDFKIFQDAERWDYISNNYSLKQMGFFQSNNNIQPAYFLLRRGGTFDLNKLDDMMKDKVINSRIYELSKGNFVLNYVNFD
jgi:4-amino-4-deoxy-L-arabinose transferase-like glycosyltransferase